MNEPPVDLLAESEGRIRDSLQRANSADEIERLADEIGERLMVAAVPELLEKLTRDSVRGDDDAFDAVCGALVRFGVMRFKGNLNFQFRPYLELPASLATALQMARPALPSYLFPE